MKALFSPLALVALCSASMAEDWTEFRGPNQMGHSSAKNVPTHWSQDSNIAWKVDVPGQGWSSPVLAKGTVYLTSAIPVEGGTRDLVALAVDAKTGQRRWLTTVFRQPANAPGIHGKNSHASPTPIIQDDRLYAHFGHQGTACLDLAGKIRWTNRELTYAPRHGNGGSPVIVGDLLIFSADAESEPFLAALDTGTGKVRWKRSRETNAAKKFSFSTPLALAVKGRWQVISPGSDLVEGLDATTGESIWKIAYDGYSVIPRPVFGRGLVYLSTGYDRAALLAVDPTGQGDVTATHLKWKQARNAPNTPSPLFVDDRLYVVSDGGIMSCVEPATGRIVWQKRLGGNFSASPLLADGKIYATSEAGVTYVVKPGDAPNVLAENDIGEHTLASLAPTDGGLFLRTADRLYRIGEKP